MMNSAQLENAYVLLSGICTVQVNIKVLCCQSKLWMILKSKKRMIKNKSQIKHIIQTRF